MPNPKSSCEIGRRGGAKALQRRAQGRQMRLIGVLEIAERPQMPRRKPIVEQPEIEAGGVSAKVGVEVAADAW